MSTNLAELVPSLQRSVAVPGTFETTFPDTTEDDLLLTLLDGFAEAQFDGWFPANTATDLGIVDPDLTRGEGALIVLYASARMLVSEIRNRKTHTRYEAGGAVYEVDQSAQTLRELLAGLNERKADLTKRARQGTVEGAFHMADQYLARVCGSGAYLSWPHMVG